jgi:flagellar L-ring protein precursor FlgH
MDALKRTIAVAAFATLLAACGSSPLRQESYAPPAPVPPPPAAEPDGSIYQAGQDVRLFEDLRAGRVGDILTIRLDEQTAASKNAQTSTDKTTSADFDGPTVFGRPVTKDGVPVLSGSLDGGSEFSGEGASSQSNSLQGDITVTVVERMANGNLRVRGEKWVTLNQGEEFIRLSGIIRPYDIEPDNSVSSRKVADARITYSSKGVLASANKMGLLSRFFNSVIWPY